MDSNLEKQFIKIIIKGRKDNTYKFALARFLLDYSNNLDDNYIKNLINSKQKEISRNAPELEFAKLRGLKPNERLSCQLSAVDGLVIDII